MRFSDPAPYRKTQAMSFAPALVDAIEPLKDPALQFRSDPGAVILHFEAPSCLSVPQTQNDPSPGGVYFIALSTRTLISLRSNMRSASTPRCSALSSR